MRSGERGVNLHLVPSSRHTNSDEKPVLSKKTSYIPRHKRHCPEKSGACSWASYKAIITKTLPKVVKGLSPDSSLKELKRTRNKARYEKSWDSWIARAIPTLYSEGHFKIQHEELLCIRAIQGHSGDAFQPHFFTDTFLQKCYVRSSTISGPQIMMTPLRDRRLLDRTSDAPKVHEATKTLNGDLKRMEEALVVSEETMDWESLEEDVHHLLRYKEDGTLEVHQ